MPIRPMAHPIMSVESSKEINRQLAILYSGLNPLGTRSGAETNCSRVAQSFSLLDDWIFHVLAVACAAVTDDFSLKAIKVADVESSMISSMDQLQLRWKICKPQWSACFIYTESNIRRSC